MALDYLKAVYEDTFNLFTGDWLGEGVHRTVFECTLDPRYVVKIEHEPMRRYFANVLEMKFWSEHSDNKRIAAWLAPCHMMSPDGRALLQRRVDPIPQDYTMPDKMPSFLNDFKRSNYGLFDGKLVCFDYAMSHHTFNTKLKKVNWIESF